MSDQKSTSSQPERTYDQVDNTVIINGNQCKHKFVMKGFRACECVKCGFGTFVNDIEDFKELMKHYGNDRQ